MGLGLSSLRLGLHNRRGGGEPSAFDDVVSYWSFDEASGNAADLASSNTLAQVGTVTRATGKIGNGATSFSDSNYFSVSNNAELDLYDTDFSFSMWLAGVASGAWIMLHKASGGTSAGRQISLGRTSGGATGIFVEIGGTNLITGNDVGATHKHVVVTFAKATLAITVYVNTTAYTTTASGAIPNAAGDLRVGRHFLTTFAANGSIDELGFWRRVLTVDEVAELYASGSGKAYPT